MLMGYAKSDEAFNTQKAMKSVIRAVIGGMVFGYFFILPSGINPISGGLMVFFAALGTDVLAHDFIKVLNKGNGAADGTSEPAAKK